MWGKLKEPLGYEQKENCVFNEGKMKYIKWVVVLWGHKRAWDKMWIFPPRQSACPSGDLGDKKTRCFSHRATDKEAWKLKSTADNNLQSEFHRKKKLLRIRNECTHSFCYCLKTKETSVLESKTHLGRRNKTISLFTQLCLKKNWKFFLWLDLKWKIRHLQ